jgi:hypothetical protein
VSTKLWARALVLFPRTIEASLAHIERQTVAKAPTLSQIALGVLRMHVRVLTRPETVGMCASHPVRSTRRARLLASRPIRFPFLVMERAIAPLDFSGLASSRERVIRHLLGAHHDGHQFVYDLELLSMHPGALLELRDRARAVVLGTDPRASWLRDLCVFDGYHESLLAAVEATLAHESAIAELPPHEANDPDITLSAYLGWCAAQPTSLRAFAGALLRGETSLGAYAPEAS